MKCDCGCQDGKVLVDADFFDSMLIELEDTLQDKSNSTPTFLPNEDLGEGIASDDELKIRGNILSFLKELYNYCESIINSDVSLTEKKKLISDSVDAFIKDAQNYIEPAIRDMYQKGKDHANDTLNKSGIVIEESKDNKDFINAIVMQQLDSIEAMGMEIKYGLIKQLNVNSIIDFYG
jgi:uncharacterized phage-associated protein